MNNLRFTFMCPSCHHPCELEYVYSDPNHSRHELRGRLLRRKVTCVTCLLQWNLSSTVQMSLDDAKPYRQEYDPHRHLDHPDAGAPGVEFDV